MRRPLLAPFASTIGLIGCLGLTSEAWAASWSVPLSAASSGEAQAQALPAAPTGVSAACAAPTTSKTIKVSWSTVTHATNYAIYQATSTTSTPGSYTKITTVTTTSYTTSTLAAGTNYWYKLATDIGTNWVGAQSTATGESTINGANPFCVQP